MYLENISSPNDLKSLSLSQLNTLADEVRQALLQKLSDHGGHIGPNLGMVEATIALHYVFQSPVDKFIFDVSHQSYAHKMLTGRKEAFLSAAHYDDVSGYTEPGESAHDHFVIGHTSTSVSLACGMVKGRDLQQGGEHVIAVIGDGSLSGGEALEGLDMAGELNAPRFVIVVNDNEMSIAENHGGLYRNLRKLRESKGNDPCNLFRAMGLDYLYVENGNDVESLIQAFKQVKGCLRPTVVHIHTEKGKGYKPAEEHKEKFHWGFPFDLATGETKPEYRFGENFGTYTSELLLRAMKQDPTIVALTAGTPGIWGWTPERRKEAGTQFVDVGIAEETAVAMLSGIGKRGGKAVFGVHSSFIQRAYDQLSQDLCINNNPATIIVFGGSLCGINDVTHLGFFDIALVSNIPNMVYLAPTCLREYEAMLTWSINQREHPVTIRIPAVPLTADTDVTTLPDYGNLNHYQTCRQGKDVAILGLGSFYTLACNVADTLQAEHGITPTVINPIYASGTDAALLDSLTSDHRLVITLEDGALDGGWGEKIARHYGPTGMKVKCYGGAKGFVDRYAYTEYLQANHLTVPQLVEECLTNLGR